MTARTTSTWTLKNTESHAWALVHRLREAQAEGAAETAAALRRQLVATRAELAEALREEERRLESARELVDALGQVLGDGAAEVAA